MVTNELSSTFFRSAGLITALEEVEFAMDLPLEEDGFEPSVPLGLSPSVSTRFFRQERWKKPVRKNIPP